MGDVVVMRSELADADDDMLKGAWPAGRCGVIGWLAVSQVSRKTGERRKRKFHKPQCVCVCE